MRGLMIMCASCAFTHMITLDGTPEEIENRINATVTDGWRYAPEFDDFICPDCMNERKPDGLYKIVYGRPKIQSKASSYMHLLHRVSEQIQNFNDLDAGRYARIESER